MNVSGHECARACDRMCMHVSMCISVGVPFRLRECLKYSVFVCLLCMYVFVCLCVIHACRCITCRLLVCQCGCDYSFIVTRILTYVCSFIVTRIFNV